MIQHVKELASQLKASTFLDLEKFVYADVEIRDPRTAANCPRRISDLTYRSIHEGCRIEIVASRCPRIRHAKRGDLIGLAGRLEIEAAHKLPIAGGCNTNWETRLDGGNAR